LGPPGRRRVLAATPQEPWKKVKTVAAKGTPFIQPFPILAARTTNVPTRPQIVRQSSMNWHVEVELSQSSPKSRLQRAAQCYDSEQQYPRRRGHRHKRALAYPAGGPQWCRFLTRLPLSALGWLPCQVTTAARSRNEPTLKMQHHSATRWPL